MTSKLAPNSKLQLDWVYGYRGHQCHDNLFYNKEGKVVYFVAGVGIVYDASAKKQRYYFEHDDDIVSLALAPDGELVASGQIGKAPYICVWSSVTMQTKSLLKEQHTHGICAVSFSSDLRVFDAKFVPAVASSGSASSTMETLITSGVKHIKFWSLAGNALTAKKGIFGKVGEIQTILCVSVLLDGRCVSGTASGDIYVWADHNLSRSLPGMHKGAVYAVQSSSSGFISGGKDGCVVFYDSSLQPTMNVNLKEGPLGYPEMSVRSVCWGGPGGGRVLAGTQGSDIFELATSGSSSAPRQLMAGHAAGELWALATHPRKEIFATGSDDLSLKIWQIEEKECLSRVAVDAKIRSCGFNKDGSQIAIGLMDGSFRVLRSRDLTEVFRAHDRKEVIHELKFSPDSRWLAVGSNDNFVDLYDATSNFKKMGVCKGNSSFITHLDWSVDSQFVRTNSGAAEDLTFRAPAGEHVIQSEVLAGIAWACRTGVLGQDVLGIWDKYTDTNDVNAADVHRSAGLVATGDDFGLVKLFRYPCTSKGSHFRKYTGHCAHVTNVRWSHDGRYLLSIGGSDQSIFQWRLLTESSQQNGGNAAVDLEESVDEASDSGLSDIEACDSELELETQPSRYDRSLSLADADRLQKVTKADLGPGQKRKSAPSNGVDLEWVHGYRGHDCRNNLFYLSCGSVVFHVAAVGVVWDRSGPRQRFYRGHTDDVLCLALHPNKDVVATGEVGREPTIHIWDAVSMAVISILKGHHDRGVCAVDFSRDGKKLASVGLDDNHCIVIWDWRKGEKLASTRAHKDKIFVVKWSPHDDELLVAVGMKYIRFWHHVGGGFTGQRGTFGTQGKLDTQLCAVFDPRPPQMSGGAAVCYTGGANGQVYVWRGNVLERTVQAHSGGCYAIDAVDKGFVTGGKDGCIHLFDENFSRVYKSYRLGGDQLASKRLLFGVETPTVRSVVLGKERILAGTHCGEVLEIASDGQINIIVQGHGEGELWGLATHSSMGICVTVSDDRSLMVWQMGDCQHKLTNRRKLPGPARCCSISPNGTAVAIGFKDGSFSVLSMQNLEPIVSNHHRKEEISDIKFSPGEGKYLAVASHDNFVDLYSTATQKRLGVCKGASSYITHIDWDIQGKLLMLNSGAKEQLFYEAPRCQRQTVSRTEMERMQWGSMTCVLGDVCVGVWPPKCDVTDVNAAALTSDGTVLATGDDFGRVKLFEYPCKTKFAKFKQYCGHSAHVTNVRWSANNDYLLSVGGADTALMVWRHRRDTVPLSHRSEAALAQIAQSEDSDTESEEENGYDSDVQREKCMDYSSKTYAVARAVELQKSLASVSAGTGKEKQPQNNLKPEISRDQAGTVTRVKSPCSVAAELPKTSSLARGGGWPIAPVVPDVSSLELTHVHGYRGFDCRNNLHFLPAQEGAPVGGAGSIVYHAAAVGIVQCLESGKQRFFVGHEDDVLCLTVLRHPRFPGPIVASGELGAKPAIHVWRASNLEIVSTLKGVHTHGVCSVNFSSTGTLLLSVGIDPQHTISVTKWQEGTVLASIGQQSQRIFLAEFRPDSDKQFVDVGVKHVKFWTLAGSQLVARRGRIPPSTQKEQPRMTTMLSVAFGTEDVTYTGAMSGDVWVWRSNELMTVVSKAHSGPVFVLYTSLEDGLIVSGGKEKGKDTGSVKLWDQKMSRCKPFHLAESVNFRGSASTTGSPLEDRSLEVIRSVSRLKGRILVGTQDNDIIEINEKSGEVRYLLQSHGEGVLSGVAVHPSLAMYASASAGDGTVKVWDLQTKMLIQSLTTGPATCIDYSAGGAVLGVGLATGAVVLLSTASYRLLGRKKDRAGAVTQIRFSPWQPVSAGVTNRQELVAVATEDCVVDIYSLPRDLEPVANGSSSHRSNSNTNNTNNKICELQRLTYCKDLSSPALYMDFSADGARLRLGLRDGGKVVVYDTASGQCLGDGSQQPDVWSSWSSPVGPEVAGLAAISADLSHSGSGCLASGDEMGLVRLHRFPCTASGQSARAFQGHSARVTGVRFVGDDSHLISSGGDDCCIFVWKCS